MEIVRRAATDPRVRRTTDLPATGRPAAIGPHERTSPTAVVVDAIRSIE
jgi:hypothetical protein